MRYRLAPGLEHLSLGDGVELRTESVSVRLEGSGSRLFVEKLVPLLGAPLTVEEIAARVPELEREALAARLEELADAGVLWHGDSQECSRHGPVPEALLALLGSTEPERRRIEERLRSLRVAIFGLEGAGANVAMQLAACGVGTLHLVDPFPCSPGDLVFWPGVAPGGDGTERQALVGAHLNRAFPSVAVTTPCSSVTRDTIPGIVERSDVLVCCFDRGFSTARSWLNRAALDRRTPVLFGELAGSHWTAGPFVVPGESACYLCWRMRTLACAPNFGEAMEYEEYLDRRREPRLAGRQALPPSAPQLASVLATELLKTVLAAGQPQLIGAVISGDLLVGSPVRHSVLQRPDCPACGRPRGARAPGRGTGGSGGGTAPDGPARSPDTSRLEDVTRALVSATCGVVRGLTIVVKDPSEPRLPEVARVELSNHRFQQGENAFMICSGKGFTAEEAAWSALGEAAERYAGSSFRPETVIYAARAELHGPSLDPRRLVLFHPDQYRSLPYAPYQDSAQLGWIEAHRWGDDGRTLVPALAVFLTYDAKSPGEVLFPCTSNGLAAGPSLEQAVLSAALEVVERDAFLLAWYHRAGVEPVDPRSHPDRNVVELCEAYRRRHLCLELYRLETDQAAYVFLALALGARDGILPAAVVGLGAHPDAATAARSAVLEVGQVRPALRIKLRSPEVRDRMERLRADPSRVTALEDHDLLYAHPAMRNAFDFLRAGPSIPFDWSASAPESTHERLDRLAATLRASGSDLLFADLTPDDVRPLGFHVVRAILPDLQPIHFGEHERRLGGRRLFDWPVRLGLRHAPADLEHLNPLPHPLA